MDVFYLEGLILMSAGYVLAAVKAYALVDALIRPAKAFSATEKLSKPAWLLILALSLLTQLLWRTPVSLFGLVGSVATFVYLVDVRPALSGVRR